MENEINFKMEKLRRKFEKLEEDSFEKDEEIKNVFNEFNEIFIKIREMGTFSENEEFKDIKTEDIKFLIIPFYQSELMQKFMENRTIRLEQALKFYSEFFKILDNYGYLKKEQKEEYKFLTKKNDEEIDIQNNSKKAFEQMSLERDEKIKQYRYKKALSEKLKVKVL
jgi:hypothetical protein